MTHWPTPLADATLLPLLDLARHDPTPDEPRRVRQFPGRTPGRLSKGVEPPTGALAGGTPSAAWNVFGLDGSGRAAVAAMRAARVRPHAPPGKPAERLAACDRRAAGAARHRRRTRGFRARRGARPAGGVTTAHVAGPAKAQP